MHSVTTRLGLWVCRPGFFFCMLVRPKDAKFNSCLQLSFLLNGSTFASCNYAYKCTHILSLKVPTIIWFCETWILFGSTFLLASVIPNVSLQVYYACVIIH